MTHSYGRNFAVADWGTTYQLPGPGRDDPVRKSMTELFFRRPDGLAGERVIDRFRGITIASTGPSARGVALSLLGSELESMVDPVEQVITALVEEIIDADDGLGSHQLSGLLMHGDDEVVIAVCESSNRVLTTPDPAVRRLCGQFERRRYGTGTLTVCRVPTTPAAASTPTSSRPRHALVSGATSEPTVATLGNSIRKYQDAVTDRDRALARNRLRAFGIVRQDAGIVPFDGEIRALYGHIERNGWAVAGVCVATDDNIGSILRILNDPTSPAQTVVVPSEAHLVGGWLERIRAVVGDVWSLDPLRQWGIESAASASFDSTAAAVVPGVER
ncbi:hypothetical protein [Nocardia brasiliensis]|uniref:hypothetical protein n=1 Tax=Nocardia brasiliensis TaxID=37326 RepID=UPI003D920796